MVRFEKGRIRFAAAFSLMGVAAGFFAACGGSSATATPQQPTASTNSVTIQLAAQNNSGQSGTATLTAVGNDQTQVALKLSAGPAGAGVAQPVHIHTGTCANLGDVVYPLNNLDNGNSTTVVKASLASMRTGGYAINAHKSDAEAGVYTACGNIPAAGQQTGPSGASQPTSPSGGAPGY